MQVGNVLYRRIDSKECVIRGFFFLHEDYTMSLIYQNLSTLKRLASSDLTLYVVFTDNTFDTVENLYTNLYMTVGEYKKMQEFIESTRNYELARKTHFEQPYEQVLPLWYEGDLVPNPR